MTDEVHEVGGIRAVVNCKGAVEADVVRIFSQEASTDGVKRSRPTQSIRHRSGLGPERLRGDPLNAPLHFGGGASRKREQHHAARIGARGNQVGDAVGERVGLAGTRTRDDEERRSFIEPAAAVFDGAALLGVERGEVGCGHCGQATPETAARPKDRFPGAILRVAPNHGV